MIKRVFGTADNITITFKHDTATGLWLAAVPADRDGEYIMSLYAEDEAGNTAYVATALFTVDVSKLCVTVEALDCTADFDASCIGAQTGSSVYADGSMTVCCASATLTNVELAVVRCEKCGRW